MSSNINPGQKIRVSVRFVDYNFYLDTDEILLPDLVKVYLYKYNSTSGSYLLVSEILPVIEVTDEVDFSSQLFEPYSPGDHTGLYYCDWTPTEDGKFRLVFTGYFYDATPSQVSSEKIFYIGSSTPDVTLSETQEFYILGELDPIYLDPLIIKTYYSDVDLVEATEIIHRISSELLAWFGPSIDITPQIEEYIIASVMCELSKIYYYGGGMAGFTTASEYMLGDLQVKRGGGSSSNSRDSLYRGNVANWCELAALLRDELMYSRNNLRSVVRGSAWENPMPERRLRRFD